MDEKFMKEQENKAFDMALAEDTINALQKKVDMLVKFIANQSISASETLCYRKAVEEMGRNAYIAYVIDTDNADYLNDDDKEYVINLLTNKD